MSSRELLPEILASIPDDWMGTTYKNSNLLGRSGFCANLTNLISSQQPITSTSLTACGNSSDYFRVGSNISTLLELALAQEKNLSVDHVISFASKRMPIVAILLTSKLSVVLYIGEEKNPFTPKQIDTLKLLDFDLAVVHSSNPITPPHPANVITLALENTQFEGKVDGFIGNNVLYITNPTLIDPLSIHTIRKRTSSPLTSPVALQRLVDIAGVPASGLEMNAHEPSNTADETRVVAFQSHLQTLCGTPVNTDSPPVIFTTGLSALCSLWFTLISRNASVGGGGCVNVVMASTAYGGSSQLTDIVTDLYPRKFRKWMFDVTGERIMVDEIRSTLDRLENEEDGGSEMATTSMMTTTSTTVIFVEIPTNPDMKVPSILALITLLEGYKTRNTSKKVMLLIDTTFAPNSKIMNMIRGLCEDLEVIMFISLSKSVSRGKTCGGCLVGNHAVGSMEVLDGVRGVCDLLDTGSKDDQLKALIGNHQNVETRCLTAYNIALQVGTHLVTSIENITGTTMKLAFVTSDNVNDGFTSSTFSFNLPVFNYKEVEEVEGLAQRFVDFLCGFEEAFKPCVSFGQDNGIVYATVPATSTQGAIKAEDKGKQTVGGVQLTRLSFPPTCDVELVMRIVGECVVSLYSKEV